MRKRLLAIGIALVFVVTGPLTTYAYEQPDGANELDEVIETENITDSVEPEEDYSIATGYVAPPDYEAPGIIEGDSDDLLETIPSSYQNPHIGTSLSLRDQNPYGTCWAFSSIGMAELSLDAQNRSSNNDLSELHLAYFTFNSVIDPLGGTEGDQAVSSSSSGLLNIGGNYEMAGNALSSWMGAADESVAKYSDKAKSINNGGKLDESLAFDDKAHLENIYQINIKNNPDYVKKCIMEYGGVGVNFYAASGTSSYTTDDIYNSKTNSYYCYYPAGPNHAVMIVGWDDNYDSSKFSVTPPGNGAWLVRNSWTTGTYNTRKNYSGYFWMSYYDQSLGEEAVVFVFDNADVYDNNYQYDGGMYSSPAFVSNGASVFETGSASLGAEELRAVAFSTDCPGASYRIDIYKDLPDRSSPVGGTLVSTEEGSLTYQGYHTIELTNPVELQKGDLFSVVVSLEGGNLLAECEISDGITDFKASADAGQSFCSDTGGSTWEDYGKQQNANLKIKAFTVDVTDAPQIPPESIEFTGEAGEGTVTINKEDTYKADYVLTPDNVTDKRVTWLTSDEGVATVDNKGVVTAVGVGTAIITAKARIGNVSSSFKVNVTRELKGLNLSADVSSEDQIVTGQKYTLKAEAVPTGALLNDEIEWNTDKPDIATVSNGIMEVHNPGVVTITANVKGSGIYGEKIFHCYLADPNVTTTMTGNLVTISFGAVKGADEYTISREYYVTDVWGYITKSEKVGTVYAEEQKSKYTITDDISTVDRTIATFVTYNVEATKGSEMSSGSDTVYMVKSYAIKYVPGIGKNPASNPKRLPEGKQVYFDPPIAPVGYSAIGWYESHYGGCIPGLPLNLNGDPQYMDYTVTAKYQPNTYKIRYYANGGTGQSMGETTATYDKSVALKPNTYSKAGYEFDGWNTEPDGVGTSFKNKQSVKNLTTQNGGIIRLYARWSGKKFNITLDAGEGRILSGTKYIQKQTVQVATKGKYPQLPTPERYGYEFDGWYTEPDGGNCVYKPDDDEFNNSITVDPDALTLYAHYTPARITVSFDSNGESAEISPDSKVYNFGENYSGLPSPIPPEGAEFIGWYAEKDCINPVTSDMAVENADDHTLYAGWFKKSKVAAPVIRSVESAGNDGTIPENSRIEITCATPGATIHYTVENGTVSTSSPVYSGSIAAYSAGNNSIYNYKVKAVAELDGYITSGVVSAEFSVMPAVLDPGDVSDEDKTEYENQSADGNTGFWVTGIQSEGYDYSGENITPEVRVYYGKKLLKLKTDYTVAYKNNKNAYELTEGDDESKENKAPSVIISLKGNYSGKITKYFTIHRIDIDDESAVNIPDIVLAYNKRVQKGTTSITYTNAAGKVIKLKAGSDYTYTYPGTDKNSDDYREESFCEINETGYNVIITGKGNFKGTSSFKEIITGKTLITKAKLDKIPDQPYTGSKPELDVSLKYGKDTLVKDTDYTVSYDDYEEVGTASVIITGIGNYSGVMTKTFKITGIPMSKVKIPADFSDSTGYSEYYDTKAKKFIYTGLPFDVAGPEDGDSDNGIELVYQQDKEAPTTWKTLEIGKDYTVSYTKNTSQGTATVVFTGKGLYTGSVKKTFKIAPYTIPAEGGRISVDVTGEVTYQKGGATPEPVVKYQIPGEDQPQIILTKGTDYTVKYSNNNKVYTLSDEDTGFSAKKAPTVTITLKGNYKGTIVRQFKIEAAQIGDMTFDIMDKAVTNKKNAFSTKYTLTDVNGKKLAAGTDYEKAVIVSYATDIILDNGSLRRSGVEVQKNDIVPEGTILNITAKGKGNYSGEITGSYRIISNDINKATVKVKPKAYTGKAIYLTTEDISVTFGREKTLLGQNDYYIASYVNNVNKGTAKVVLKGKGNYGGTKTVNFPITDAKP